MDMHLFSCVRSLTHSWSWSGNYFRQAILGWMIGRSLYFRAQRLLSFFFDFHFILCRLLSFLCSRFQCLLLLSSLICFYFFTLFDALLWLESCLTISLYNFELRRTSFVQSDMNSRRSFSLLTCFDDQWGSRFAYRLFLIVWNSRISLRLNPLFSRWCYFLNIWSRGGSSGGRFNCSLRTFLFLETPILILCNFNNLIFQFSSNRSNRHIHFRPCCLNRFWNIRSRWLSFKLFQWLVLYQVLLVSIFHISFHVFKKLIFLF